MSERRFTVEEVNALLPAITPLLESLRDAQEVMEERHEEVMASIPTNGGGGVHREFVGAATEAERILRALTDLGVVVRDPAVGLVDFPAIRDGAEVFLCWRLGEECVGWWHPTDTGFAGREPL